MTLFIFQIRISFDLASYTTKNVIDKNWFADASYTYTPLSTRNTLSTGQTLDIKLDPSSFSLAVGYKF